MLKNAEGGPFVIFKNMVPKKYAIVVDGAYLRQKMCDEANGVWPDGTKIYQKIQNIAAKHFPDDDLFRIFYYDALAEDDGHLRNNPVDGSKTELLANINYEHTQKSYDVLKRQDKLAFRYGHLGYSGWKLKNIGRFVGKMKAGKELRPDDFTIDLRQKGVDMKIGLDIAWLSMKKIVDQIVIISADSDFVPAMKLARKEGLEVMVVSIGHKLKTNMVEHCDKFIIHKTDKKPGK
jgi:uncharacterized LabA/DUF88 family protein